MLNHSWDSPRNSHLDVPTLVITQAQSMYLELAPSEGQSQCQATIPAFISKFLVFVALINRQFTNRLIYIKKNAVHSLILQTWQ